MIAYERSHRDDECNSEIEMNINVADGMWGQTRFKLGYARVASDIWGHRPLCVIIVSISLWRFVPDSKRTPPARLTVCIGSFFGWSASVWDVRPRLPHLDDPTPERLGLVFRLVPWQKRAFQSGNQGNRSNNRPTAASSPWTRRNNDGSGDSVAGDVARLYCLRHR